MNLRFATFEEALAFDEASSMSGIGLTSHVDLNGLYEHPTVKTERALKPRHYDDAYLVVADGIFPKMIRWFGRAPSGYRFPFGQTMVILDDEGAENV